MVFGTLFSGLVFPRRGYFLGVDFLRSELDGLSDENHRQG